MIFSKKTPKYLTNLESNRKVNNSKIKKLQTKQVKTDTRHLRSKVVFEECLILYLWHGFLSQSENTNKITNNQMVSKNQIPISCHKES